MIQDSRSASEVGAGKRWSDVRPCVTLSIVSHGQAALVCSLLNQISQRSVTSVKAIIVTENRPEVDVNWPMRDSFPLRILRNDSPKGFGANHNQAFSHCDTEWFAILNPDISVGSDALAALLSHAADTDVILAPRILNPDGSVADSFRRIPTPLRLLYRYVSRRADALEQSDWLAGMFLLVRSEKFRALGGFDERYFMYCEDVDLCLRAQLAGWSIRQVPGVTVVHDAQRSSHRSLRYLQWHARSLLRLWCSPVLRKYLAQRSSIVKRRATVAAA